HRSPDHGEAEARPRVSLGGEKGLKSPLTDLRAHPVTVVFNLEGRRLPDPLIPEPKSDLSAYRERVPRVQDQVQEDLLEARGSDCYFAHRLQLMLDVDVGG